MKRLRVCVVTGSRGEYGALRWLMKDMSADSSFDMRLVVTGSHLLGRFGFTYRELERDGYRIDARVRCDFDTDSSTSLARAVGRWTEGLAKAFDRLKPDLVVVAGDRYELLAIGSACLLLLIPMAHISGGEVTEGAIDEQIRHATTKLSHLHYVSNEAFAARVRQMGEEPWRVRVSGDPGLDTVRRLRMMTRGELEKLLKLDLSRPTALCTFHPVTLEAERTGDQVAEYLAALERVGLQCVMTYPNADHGSGAVLGALKRFAARRPDTARLVASLGQHAYLSLMKQADLMIGNSSSGVWEAPSLNLPVVNIGNRQQGRPRARNVVDVPCERAAILSGVRKALRYDRSKPCENPYGDGRASARIIRHIKGVFATKDKETILKKKFVDLRN